jgi:hypothetical protein
VIPRLLGLFEEFEVAASWATVGFLFASSREELVRSTPPLKPEYVDRRLSPFQEPLGANETEDPLHYAASLVRRIQRTPRQEIATHTFSHYYCDEPGQTKETFRADLVAARHAAETYGVKLRSIVFPRNQHNAAYDDVLLEQGISAYRGNPRSKRWSFTGAEEGRRLWKRAARMAETYLGDGDDSTVGWDDVPQPSGLSDVRATTLLRPYRPALRQLETLRLAKIRRGLQSAARAGRIFHLWWHPHNFGDHQEQNLDFLRRILDEYAVCRDRHGMRSLSMAAVDTLVRGGGLSVEGSSCSEYSPSAASRAC